jgi:5-(carboxyamino)imidazole ribonucleotide mutase
MAGTSALNSLSLSISFKSDGAGEKRSPVASTDNTASVPCRTSSPCLAGLCSNDSDTQMADELSSGGESLLSPESQLATSKPLVGLIMGSRSDWDTMQRTSETLSQLGVPHENRIVSAHRTPDLMTEYAKTALHRGLEVIIAAAGGAAHLPGMVAAHTTLPVLGVPIKSSILNGVDSLLSIVQMPAGVPVGTLAVGNAGATNAALLAASILANKYAPIRSALEQFRRRQTDSVLQDTLS